ncbi:GHMP kinase [Halogeometricum sp. CBA1124]|uniref:GHMP family kinase ATP-binding protein n=1 Tax=Halogeometricum sp. CBA1124 TaxID=2668071 RepID=UPI001E604BB3|nr:GHMP kinase [Halogeometricum sp. CBA1124]
MTTAYAPGSVTTVFVPRSDPAEGSLGVSFAVEDGVRATVEPADETTVRLDGSTTAFEPVAGVLDRLGVTAAVSLSADAPVGRGFGASGAATLATALAVVAEFDLDADREDALEAAHRAEVTAGTGLGDVFVQDVGGFVWNTGDGRDRTERTDRIEYSSMGDIATRDVLDDESAVANVADAGTETLSAFHPGDSLQAWFEASWASRSEPNCRRRPSNGRSNASSTPAARRRWRWWVRRCWRRASTASSTRRRASRTRALTCCRHRK